MHREAEYRVSLFEMMKAHKETFLALCHGCALGVIFCARRRAMAALKSVRAVGCGCVRVGKVAGRGPI